MDEDTIFSFPSTAPNLIGGIILISLEMKKWFFVLTAFIALQIGCKKDSAPKEDSVQPKFSNFDFVGASHNSGLSAFFSNYTAGKVKSDKLDYNTLSLFIASHSEIKDSIFTLKVLNSPIYVQTRNVGLADLSKVLLSKSLISSNFGQYLDKINSSIDSNFEKGPSVLANAIQLISSQINSDNNLSQTEKGTLLAALSVGKFSSSFWDANLETLKNEWTIQNSSGSVKLIKTDLAPAPVSGNGVKIVKADVAGAVAGGVAGAVIGGVVATPVGSVPGYVAGAVTGGITNSVTEAVTQLLDWLF